MGDENSTFYAGIDWGEEHHQLCVVDDRGHGAPRSKSATM
jgi:hypothetical protein